MERIHITYLLIFLLVTLGSLIAGFFVTSVRSTMREKRNREVRLRNEAQLVADREKAFQDKYGQ